MIRTWNQGMLNRKNDAATLRRCLAKRFRKCAVAFQHLEPRHLLAGDVGVDLVDQT